MISKRHKIRIREIFSTMLTGRRLRSRLLKRADVNDHIRHVLPPLEVLMARKVDPKVDEAIETLNLRDSPTRRRLIAGAGLVSATAAASALLAACSSNSSAANAASGSGAFPSTPTWQFWFVNPVTTNPFSVPTQYGLADCAKLLGIPAPKWTGSTNSVASQMAAQINAAVAAKAAGSAPARIGSTSFTTPVGNAMSAGIPVLSYNADGDVNKGVPDIGCNRLAYIARGLYTAREHLRQRVKSLLPT